MTQRTPVPSRPPSALVASSAVALSPVGPSCVALPSLLALSPDVVRLLEVFARIELRRQLRLRALTTVHTTEEAS
jgi:hypothetical protein